MPRVVTPWGATSLNMGAHPRGMAAVARPEYLRGPAGLSDPSLRHYTQNWTRENVRWQLAAEQVQAEDSGNSGKVGFQGQPEFLPISTGQRLRKVIGFR